MAKITNVKLVDQFQEPFEYKDVKEMSVQDGVLEFVDSEGTRHITNSDFHVKVIQKND